MRKNRILSFLLAVCVLATTISIQVAPLTVKAYENTLFSDDFNSGVFDATVDGNAWGGKKWFDDSPNSGIEIKDFPSSDNKSLEFAKSENTNKSNNCIAETRPFAGTTISAGNLAVVNAKLATKNKRGGFQTQIFSSADEVLARVVMGPYTDSTTDPGAYDKYANGFPVGISVSNGKGGYINILPTYTLAQFYSFRFIVDISNKQFDLYLDDILVADNVSLNSTTKTYNNLGKITFSVDANGSGTSAGTREHYLDDFSTGILVEDPIIPYVAPAQKEPLATREMIYQNDFSNTSFDNRIVVNNSGGQCEISDGTLNITRTNNNAITSTRIYADENKGAATDFLKIGYTLSRTSTKEVQQVLNSSIGKILLLDWLTDGTMKISYNDTGALAVSTIPSYVYSDDVDVLVYINPYDSKVSLWLDGKLILDNKYTYVSNIKDIVNLDTSLVGANYTTAKLDNVTIDYSYPEDSQVAKYDENLLTIDSLLTKPFLRDNLIDADLNMSTAGFYGSNITWESSNPSVIATNGKVTQPVDLLDNTEVKLKATISAYGVVKTKEFTYMVYPYFSNVEAASRYAKNTFNFEKILKEKANEITVSLDLPYIGGSYLPIKWRSNMKSIISDNGNVTRPRWDKENAEVILTADFGNGVTQDYSLKVLADEMWKDPMYTEYTKTTLNSDEEFFGKWDSAKGEWVKVSKAGDYIYSTTNPSHDLPVKLPDVPSGRFDYTKPGLEKIEAAVKAGDYAQAKVELLEYMRNRKNPSIYGLSSRNTGYANSAVTGVYMAQGDKYYQGDGVFNPFEINGDKYQLVAIPIKTSNLTKGGTTTFSITAKYNETSAILITSKEYPDANLRPQLEVKVNGQTRYYNVDIDGMARGGQYVKTNYGTQPEMKVKMFGDVCGDETYKAVMRFGLTDLIDTDVISDARILVYAKGTDGFAGTKKILAILESPDEDLGTLDETNLAFDRFDGLLYNLNGVPGGNDWLGKYYNASVVFTNQAPRFQTVNSLATEYAYTKDETYAYAALSQMMDYINDVGGAMDFDVYYDYASDPNKGHWDIESKTVEPEGAPTGTKKLYGQYPGSMHSCFKMYHWNAAMPSLMKSKYMTPEIYTAILKNLYYSIDGLIYSTGKVNGRLTGFMTLLQATLYYPEFYLHDFVHPFPSFYAYGIDTGYTYGNANPTYDLYNVRNNIYNRLTYAIDQISLFTLNLFMDDGSYKEASDMYSLSTYTKMVEFKSMMEAGNSPTSEEFNSKLYKGGYYNALFRAPDGTNLAYGDSVNGKSTGSRFPEVAEWYNDRELEYISTLGKEGTVPSKTSFHFPETAITFMRANWTQSSPFALVTARGYSTHNHADDNAMTVYAYGRMLLTDQGIFKYGSTASVDVWGNGIQGHNTITVDDKTAADGDPATVHNWVSNNKVDFLSQSSNEYKGSYGDHKRTITFIKPRFWIVSDVMTPKTATTQYTYRQRWHMLPTANVSINGADGTISSNFESGANIILASPDVKNNANAGGTVYIEDGADADKDGEFAVYDSGYSQLSSAPYGIFTKVAKGITSIDTVIMPVDGKNATIQTERIDLGAGVTGDIASAMKFETTVDDVYSKNYYLLNYKNVLSTMTAFDKYKSDGKSTLVTEDKKGSWNEIHLINGNKVTRTDETTKVVDGKNVTTSTDTTLVDIGTNNDMSFEIKGNVLFVDTSITTPDFSQVVVNTDKNIAGVQYGDKGISFTKDQDNKIRLSNNYVPPMKLPDDSKPIEIVQKDDGKGDDGKDDTGNGDDVIVTPPLVDAFKDIAIHWAKQAITEMKQKGIVKGDLEGKFNPDNKVTRAEMIAMIVRALGLKEAAYTGKFSDVTAKDWYAGVIQIALDVGLISNADTFRPNDNITREEMSKIIANSAGKLKVLDEVPQDFKVAYPDSNNISDWAKDYVRFVTYHKFMKGMDDGTFAPKGSATRAEIATVISRILN